MYSQSDYILTAMAMDIICHDEMKALARDNVIVLHGRYHDRKIGCIGRRLAFHVACLEMDKAEEEALLLIKELTAILPGDFRSRMPDAYNELMRHIPAKIKTFFGEKYKMAC